MIYFLDFKASYTIYMIQNESRVSKLCSWSFKTMWGGNYPTLLETQNFMTPCYFGYIKVDGVSSVFCFIWGWEEPAWGLPFQFHGVFFVMISMKGPWYASVIWTQKRSALKPTTALVRSRSLMNSSMICFIASNFNSYSQFDYDADIRSIVLFLVPCPHCSVCSRV